MAEGKVSFKLDLIVNLRDTTTGLPVTEREVIFHINESVVPFLSREEGIYVLMNYGRTNIDLKITVKGFLAVTIPVRYEELSEQYPFIEVAMIPIVRSYGYNSLGTLSGVMPGITDIAAISLNRTDAMLGAYLAKKNSLRLFETRRLDERSYAVFHEEEMEFEEFCIVKITEKGLLLQLQSALEKPCKPEEGIARIVRGTIDANGRYLLRVRMDGKGTKYLVRYIVDGITKFQQVEFGEETERRLE